MEDMKCQICNQRKAEFYTLSLVELLSWFVCERCCCLKKMQHPQEPVYPIEEAWICLDGDMWHSPIDIQAKRLWMNRRKQYRKIKQFEN